VRSFSQSKKNIEKQKKSSESLILQNPIGKFLKNKKNNKPNNKKKKSSGGSRSWIHPLKKSNSITTFII
jgi:hypothetical protein